MHLYLVEELMNKQKQTGELYHEFLREHTMSMGLYRLAAGTTDQQKPHSEDEVYYVIEGHACFQSKSEEIQVQPGSIIYVKAHDEHRFHSITVDLTVLVFFAPAEGSTQSNDTY
jgi:mannose-6-phosphate isomerase-like protein (cupin superfamily)